MPPAVMASTCLVPAVEEGLVHEVGRQHAEEVAEKQEQYADVEQVAAQFQLRGLEQLRGVAFPGVLVPVESESGCPAGKTLRQRYGIQTEEEGVKCVHGETPV
jgi:hypothetical protein